MLFIIHNQLINTILKSIEFKDESSEAQGNKNFSDQQLIFLELYLKIDKIRRKSGVSKKIGNIESSYVKNYKNNKKVLTENDNFDRLLYLEHLQ
jgi:hypothetical protein